MKKKRFIIILFSVLLCLTGCSSNAKAAKNAKGWKFSVPDGWKVTSEEKVNDKLTVTVLETEEKDKITIYNGAVPEGYADFVFNEYCKSGGYEDRSIFGVKQALKDGELFRVVVRKGKKSCMLVEKVKKGDFRAVEKSVVPVSNK